MALDLLYQDLLLEHYRHPRNFGKLAKPTYRLRHDNPLCGDLLELSIILSAQSEIHAIRFHGRGCVISQASASMMTEAVQGKSLEQVRALSACFQKLFSVAPAANDVRLAGLLAFAALRDFPSRVTCATLAWEALDFCLATGMDSRENHASEPDFLCTELNSFSESDGPKT